MSSLTYALPLQPLFILQLQVNCSSSFSLFNAQVQQAASFIPAAQKWWWCIRSSEDFFEREMDSSFFIAVHSMDWSILFGWTDVSRLLLVQVPTLPYSTTDTLACMCASHSTVHLCSWHLYQNSKRGWRWGESTVCPQSTTLACNHGGGGTTNPVLHSRLTFLQSSLLQL